MMCAHSEWQRTSQELVQRPGSATSGYGSMMAAWTSWLSWLRSGSELLGRSWVMNTTDRSRTGSTQKAVLAAPPHPWSPTLPGTLAVTGRW